ncbi:uncharacterized protein APUU_80498S [Aspergillus puulaauensis]|uniref:Uncharacterized protein n=1 Tax=Aspergillus puulaauensis TaxID=1220207 RepID=A0A7R7XYR8_9EURO|nr:uncharacterized protein APUU_80498S [Aspergillus puulaauensis]BCS30195.1 hypothetical protein APUU_80498S [Aspergillus puulaauensis]
MSFLVSIRASSRQATRSNLTASRFHTSAARSLDENDRHREDLPNHYESNKQESLNDNKDGKGKWRSELASSSEQNVRADRGEFNGEHPSFDAMQQKTNHKGPGNK